MKMKIDMTKFAGRLAGVTVLAGLLAVAAVAQKPQDVPEAPAPQPQTNQNPLSDLKDQVTPGKGEIAPQPQAPATETPRPPANTDPAPDMPTAAELKQYMKNAVTVSTSFVEVPVTIKDSNHNLVSGLTFRDFKVLENGQPQPLKLFTVDPFPLSVAFVIDQSVTVDVMAKVNASLRAIQGALTPYDEIAIYTYNNGAQERTGFTGAQSARVPAVLEASKGIGSEMGVPVNSGPLASGPTINGHSIDPNLDPGRSAGGGSFMNIPKEIHTLNDAILQAAFALTTVDKGRRRIIYVISDGKESGSKAKFSEVIKVLQTHNIAVYGTLVGDSARWGEGYVSRFHIPLFAYDNLLPRYAIATGGALDAEHSTNGIEKSYARLAEEARARYTLGYNSHQPLIDGKFRKIEVLINRPGLEVIAKTGYYPAASGNH
jgi:VWFA-related protein